MHTRVTRLGAAHRHLHSLLLDGVCLRLASSGALVRLPALPTTICRQRPGHLSTRLIRGVPRGVIGASSAFSSCIVLMNSLRKRYIPESPAWRCTQPLAQPPSLWRGLEITSFSCQPASPRSRASQRYRCVSLRPPSHGTPRCTKVWCVSQAMTMATVTPQPNDTPLAYHHAGQILFYLRRLFFLPFILYKYSHIETWAATLRVCSLLIARGRCVENTDPALEGAPTLLHHVSCSLWRFLFEVRQFVRNSDISFVSSRSTSGCDFSLTRRSFFHPPCEC